MNSVAPQLVDLTEYLPRGWQSDLQELVRAHGRRVERVGAGEGSLTTDGLRYTVVDGETLWRGETGSWLPSVYRALAPMMSGLLSEPVHIDDHLASSININHHAGIGEEYELHTDGRPYTLLLFGTTMSIDDGGELIVQIDSINAQFRPVAGYGLLFDGQALPHKVRPLKRNLERITVPMVFLPANAPVRPVGLDAHLYAHDE